MANIEKREITSELKESYLDYAMSVIVARALPDVRDGLKPVQRRILWAMWDSGLTADAKLRKSANVVGEVMGRYHPHGDTAIYDTIVRMAQDFSLRYPLIIGQGNWGCFTGDTKVKLADGRSLTFKELIQEFHAGKKNYTYTFDHRLQKIEIAEIKRPRLTKRNANILRVILDDGERIRCTLNHKFMLRDGSYKEAQELRPGDSLMPGYTRLSTKKDDVNAVGYAMMYQPVGHEWNWVHRLSDAWNLTHHVYPKSAGRVRHHRDFNKLNNNPENIVRLDWKKHWQLHYELASWRHKHDLAYVQKLADGRAKYIDEHRHLFAERAKNLNKKLWNSKTFRENHRERIQKMWANPTYKERMRAISSATLTKTWEGEAYRTMMRALKSKELKERWRNPSYRSAWSQRMKEISQLLWSNAAHREHISRLNRERTANPEWRKRQSIVSKRLWQNPEYRAKYPRDHFSQMAKKLWENPEMKAYHAKRAKEQWLNEDFRKKVSASVQARNSKFAKEYPEHFTMMTEKAALSLRKNWRDPAYKQQIIKNKILGYAYNVLRKYHALTPTIYERERTNNGVPRLENALRYFGIFQKIRENAPLYNHRVQKIEFLTVKEDVYDLTIDGTHNFLLDAGIFVHNSIDGDNAAAMRYTETKLAKISAELLTDIERETVDWQPNYDGSRMEPKVLPAKLPHLLLNGAVGIAVGMATSIPPHNLGEVVDATLHLIANPKATPSELATFVKGPDFPTGGIIFDRRAIAEAYATGRGAITTRGVAEIEERPGSKSSFDIVITEIPYQVVKAELVVKIAELVTGKRIEGIRDIRDESDKEGLRVVIELKNDAAPQKVLNQLYQHTDLQKDFHLNMIALVDVLDPNDRTGQTRGLQPQVLSLKDVLTAYVAHREEVVKRRATFDLKRAEERAHILEGLSKALSVIDKIIATIKKSADRDEAKKNLIAHFKLTEIQANAILEMRLQTLAALEQKKIEDELKEKRKLIADLKALLASPAKIRNVIKDELTDVRSRYADERRTKVVATGLSAFREEDLIPQEETIITFSGSGYVKRLPPGTFRSQRRGGKGLIGSDVAEEDFLTHLIAAETHDNILFFTDRGRVFQTKVWEIPAASRTAKGKPIHNFLEIPSEENVKAIVTYPENGKAESNEQYVVMATERGIVKKTSLADFGNVRRTGIIAMKLKKGDLLKWVKMSGGKDEIIVTTQAGQSIRFKESQIRSMGRAASGVRAIRLKGSDAVSSMDIAPENQKSTKISAEGGKNQRLLVIMANGYGKQTPLSQYRLQRRGGSGIKTAKITKKTGPLMTAHLVTDEEEIIALSSKGQIIKTRLADVRVAGRATQGVKIMTLNAGDKLVAAICL